MPQRRNLSGKPLGRPLGRNAGLDFKSGLQAKPKGVGVQAAPPAPPVSKTDPTGNPKVTMPTGPKAITAEDFTKNGEAGVLGLSSFNPSSGQPDPRSPDYWKNFYLLQSQAKTAYGTALNDQTQADVAYSRNSNDMATSQDRAKKSLARSLIGTGLLRSGYHNAQQTEGLGDYLTQVSRAGSDKASADVARSDARKGILGDFAAQEYGLYSDAATAYADQQATNAAEGDPVYGGKRSLKSYNTQLSTLKAKYKAAESDQQRKAILGKIKKTRSAKNKQYGKK